MYPMGAAATTWIVAAAVLWILLVGGAVWAVARIVQRPPHRPVELPSPLDILERRYAEGKISREDFDEARARLREHALDR